jgi:dolichol-phosphate mannosyltransferase
MARFSFNPQQIGSRLTAPLVIVMPIYNEEANIAEVISRWLECLRELKADFQIIALDDGSKDGTLDILLRLEALQPDVLCVVHKPNGGHGPTCRIGYEIAINSNAEWVLQIDSDGQCDPRHFLDFWNKRHDCDCIFGLRRSREDGAARIITSAICRLGSSLISGQDLKDPNVPYRLIRKRALQEALKHIPARFNIHNVALTYVLKNLPGLRWGYVAIHFPVRKRGQNSINVLQVITWGVDMLLELTRIRARLSRSIS